MTFTSLPPHALTGAALGMKVPPDTLRVAKSLDVHAWSVDRM